MSFGFGISDFITILQLANDIRKEFVDAPSQFKAISDELGSSVNNMYGDSFYNLIGSKAFPMSSEILKTP